MPTLFTKIRNKIAYIRNDYVFEHFAIPLFKAERISKKGLKKYLPANPVVIDCGAHIGSDSLTLQRILDATVYAFEPLPAIYDRLCRNTGANKRIFPIRQALSDKTGKSFFYVSEGGSDGSSSLLPPKDHLVDHQTVFFNEKIEVDTITLDDWAAQANIRSVDLLWLDMQGYEWKMLQASERILPTVKVIHTEVSMKETYEGVTRYPEYREYLESIGFTMQIEAIPPGWDMGNVLFVRK